MMCTPTNKFNPAAARCNGCFSIVIIIIIIVIIIIIIIIIIIMNNK